MGEGRGLELQCYGSHAVETSHRDVSHGRVALTLVVPIVVDVARSCIVTVEDIVEVGTEHNLLQAKHTLREVECVRSVHVKSVNSRAVSDQSSRCCRDTAC